VQFTVITADDAETSYEGTYRGLDNAVLVLDPRTRASQLSDCPRRTGGRLSSRARTTTFWRACVERQNPVVRVQGTRGSGLQNSYNRFPTLRAASSMTAFANNRMTFAATAS
jgi:hypothetical protein